MKNLLLLILVSINSYVSNANYFINNSKSIKTDTTIIHQIIFSRSGNPGWDKEELLEKNQFTIIFKENGEVQLKRNGKCPTSKNSTVICAYTGQIEIKEFERLSAKLKAIHFTDLKDAYLENIDDGGSNNYLITYNQVKQKRIIDENFEIPGLKEFNKMLMELKKQIHWVPNQ
jgi:hypothetical protein